MGFVVGGTAEAFGSEIILNDVREVDMSLGEELSSECQRHSVLLPLQSPVAAAAGGLPVVCGGNDGVTGPTKQCYQYQTELTSWTEFPSLLEEREAAAAVQVDQDRFLVAGGRGSDGEPLASVEEFRDGSFAQFGFGLLEPLSETCLVAVDADTVLVVGGMDGAGEAVDNAFYLDLASGAVLPAPSMNGARNAHACGLVEVDGVRGVVAAGGRPDPATVEFLPLDGVEWQQLSDHPEGGVSHAAYAVHDGDLFTFGGRRRDGFILGGAWMLRSADGVWEDVTDAMGGYFVLGTRQFADAAAVAVGGDATGCA